VSNEAIMSGRNKLKLYANPGPAILDSTVITSHMYWVFPIDLRICFVFLRILFFFICAHVNILYYKKTKKQKNKKTKQMRKSIGKKKQYSSTIANKKLSKV
jgi:hypothetical protein